MTKKEEDAYNTVMDLISAHGIDTLVFSAIVLSWEPDLAAHNLTRALVGLRDKPLAECLENYTNPDHPEYDAEFDAHIRQLRPDWFAEETKH